MHEAIAGGWILDALANKLDTRQSGALKGQLNSNDLDDMLHHWHAAVDSGNSAEVLIVYCDKVFDHINNWQVQTARHHPDQLCDGYFSN